MLKISWKANESAIAAMRSKGPRIVSVLMSKVNLLMLQLGSFVQTQKLTGQVLGVRSGKLRASIHALPTRISGTKIIGEVQQDPTVAMYGSLHEHGVPHPWEIIATKQRFLRFLTDGKMRFAKSVSHPALPKRSFMQSSEDENRTRIFAELQKAVNDAVSEK
jgi:hypothetical protein